MSLEFTFATNDIVILAIMKLSSMSQLWKLKLTFVAMTLSDEIEREVGERCASLLRIQ